VKKGKTPVLSAEQARQLLDAIDVSTITGLRDRAIIAARQLLFEALDAIDAGESPRGTAPADYSSVRPVDLQIPHNADWREVLAPELVARF